MTTEYNIEATEGFLTLRRTKSWIFGSLIGSLFLLAGMLLFIRGVLMHPVDKISLLMYLVILCGMLFVTHKLIIWGRQIVFDKLNNQILVDGHKLCALSDLNVIQMEGYQNRFMFFKPSCLYSLHLKTVQGKDVVLKNVWENSPEYNKTLEFVHAITEFTGAELVWHSINNSKR